MNFLTIIILSLLLPTQKLQAEDYRGFVEDTAEEKIYFFCHSRLIDISEEETQHVVIAGIYEKTANDKQVWEIVRKWTEFVNTDYQNNCRRTSNLNRYSSREEAETQLELFQLHYLGRERVIVAKVEFPK